MKNIWKRPRELKNLFATFFSLKKFLEVMTGQIDIMPSSSASEYCQLFPTIFRDYFCYFFAIFLFLAHSYSIPFIGIVEVFVLLWTHSVFFTSRSPRAMCCNTNIGNIFRRIHDYSWKKPAFPQRYFSENSKVIWIEKATSLWVAQAVLNAKYAHVLFLLSRSTFCLFSVNAFLKLDIPPLKSILKEEFYQEIFTMP